MEREGEEGSWGRDDAVVLDLAVVTQERGFRV